MKVERIYTGEITVEKLLKELLNTQIDNLITQHSNVTFLEESVNGSDKP